MTTAMRTEAIPTITAGEVESLARAECERFADQLRDLDPGDWAKPTDCPGWDVRAMAGHTTGMLSTFTGYRTVMAAMIRATTAAKRSGEPLIDALTARQVSDHAGLSTSELIAKLDEFGPRAARWRATRPTLFRRMPVKQEVAGHTETWRMGYLLDVILTRDVWMHRADVARATGRQPVLTAEHDGRLVGDIVAEWARRHGAPCTLTLTGPAGGEFVSGAGGEHITIDAVEFCRTVSGRATGAGLLAHEVPF